MSVDLSAYKKIEKQLLKEIKDDILKNDIALMRINRSGILVPVSKSDIDIILNSSKSIDLYIRKDDRKKINITYGNNALNQSKDTIDPSILSEKDTVNRIIKFQKMSLAEKVSAIDAHAKRISASLREKALTKEVAYDVIESQTDASLILKSTVFESFKQVRNKSKTFADVQNENRELMKVTKDLVVDIVKVLAKDPDTKDIFENLQHFQEGGTSAHSNRVFVMFTDFIRFYNNKTSESSFLSKMRMRFSNEFKHLYQGILDKYNTYKSIETIEDAIESGLGRLSENELLNLPVAALLHDIGKVKDIDYFEGESARDVERIQRHLFNGYYLMTKMVDITNEMAFTIGFHHEYNGYGYGPYTSMCDKRKQKDSWFRIPYVMTYRADSMANCHAVGYFPSKVLEVIDVYDALMDPARKYRHGRCFTQAEALTIMENDFIKQHTKLDPILFSIFKEYLESDIPNIHKEP